MITDADEIGRLQKADAPIDDAPDRDGRRLAAIRRPSGSGRIAGAFPLVGLRLRDQARLAEHFEATCLSTSGWTIIHPRLDLHARLRGIIEATSRHAHTRGPGDTR